MHQFNFRVPCSSAEITTPKIGNSLVPYGETPKSEKKKEKHLMVGPQLPTKEEMMDTESKSESKKSSDVTGPQLKGVQIGPQLPPEGVSKMSRVSSLSMLDYDDSDNEDEVTSQSEGKKKGILLKIVLNLSLASLLMDSYFDDVHNVIF